MGVGSAKCKSDTCTRSTTGLYCWQHWYLNYSDTEEGARSGRLDRLNTNKGKGGYDDPAEQHEGEFNGSTPIQIWSDTKKVFIDIQDSINPEGIRDQVRSYAEGAATTAALRFARDERLETDPALRDLHIENFSSDVVEGLVPTGELVSQDDAEFISNAIPSDGLGGFADYDDARAIISYGIRKEWELANAESIKESADGIPYDIPYQSFLSVVYNNDIAPHVVIASRREASDFHNNVLIATGSKAANPAAVNPANALPARAEAEPIHSDYFQEARAWVEKNAADRQAQEQAQEEADRLYAERIKQRQDAISGALNGTANLAKGTIHAVGATAAFMDKLFGTRPEDTEALRKRRNQQNRDAFFDMATRNYRNKRGL